MTQSASMIPLGNRKPAVGTVQHSVPSVAAVEHGGRWVIQTFRGATGPF